MIMSLGLGVATAAFAAQPLAGDRDAWATAAALAGARAAAPTVVLAFMESVRQPRGTWGHCPADGIVLTVERGQLRRGQTRVSANVPCATQPHAPLASDPLRRIPMRFLHSRTFARLYYDQHGRLIDYQALRLSSEELPPGW